MHMAFSLCQLRWIDCQKAVIEYAYGFFSLPAKVDWLSNCSCWICKLFFSLYQLRWIDCQKAVVEYAYGLFFSLPAKVDWLPKSSLIDCQKPWNLDIVKLEVIKNWKKLLTMHMAFSLCQLRWIDCQKAVIEYAYGFFSLPAKVDWLSKSSCWNCIWFFLSTS